MKLLTVHYCGWGEDWPLGRLADDGQSLLFEYSPEALSQGLELSPLHLKLRADAYGSFPGHLHRLPGLIADSLPSVSGMTGAGVWRRKAASRRNRRRRSSTECCCRQAHSASGLSALRSGR